MVITSDYYTLYHHYKTLAEQYNKLSAYHHAYRYLSYWLDGHLQSSLPEQRKQVEQVIYEIENYEPCSYNVRKVWLEEVKTLRTFLSKTKGEYSE